MHPDTLRDTLYRFTAEHSGHDPHRLDESGNPYLGMSRIYLDERRLVDELAYGPHAPDDATHQQFYLGNLLERDLIQRMTAAGLLTGTRPECAVARFDARFRGHPDGETPQGDLVEIKTSTLHRFRQVSENARIPRAHFQQIQCYMRHGRGGTQPYARCHVVYFARETGEVHVKTVPRLDQVGADLDEKARRVLALYDERMRVEAAIAEDS